MKLFKILSILVFTSVLMNACKPDPGPSGVEYNSASSSFKILSFSSSKGANSSIDLTKDSLKFEAEFNEPVTWFIDVVGKSHPTDRATTRISGTSKSLSLKETFWNGISDNLYFFKKNELVDVKLSFLGSDTIILLNNLKIAKPKSFQIPGKTVVILDFEGDTESSLLSSTSDVNVFFDSRNKPEGLDSTKFNFKTQLNNNLPTSLQGKNFVYLRGRDLVSEPDPFYIGGFNLNPKNFGLQKDKSLDEIYFNFYANSNGNKTTKIVVDLFGVGGDQFSLTRDVTWTGWQLVTAKLSDFIQTKSGANGTGLILPQALKNFTIGLHSGGAPGREAEFLVDFVCFSYGAPFSQKIK
jgi:hypothetical protein